MDRCNLVNLTIMTCCSSSGVFVWNLFNFHLSVFFFNFFFMSPSFNFFFKNRTFLNFEFSEFFFSESKNLNFRWQSFDKIRFWLDDGSIRHIWLDWLTVSHSRIGWVRYESLITRWWISCSYFSILREWKRFSRCSARFLLIGEIYTVYLKKMHFKGNRKSADVQSYSCDMRLVLIEQHIGYVT